jgi:hypothetical protein
LTSKDEGGVKSWKRHGVFQSDGLLPRAYQNSFSRLSPSQKPFTDTIRVKEIFGLWDVLNPLTSRKE